MINFITVLKNNKGNVKTVVYYNSKRTRCFTEHDNQPKSVVMFKLASRNVRTTCHPDGTVTIFK